MTLRALSRGLIVLFCLWHMGAVAIEAIPQDVPTPLIRDTRAALLPVIRPYLYLTSQWQMWNLFSPDPLRRVVEYRIDASIRDRWQVMRTLTPGSSRWWRRTHEFSLARTMDNVQGGSDLLRSRYIQAYCPFLGLATGTPIRLVFHVAILPMAGSGDLRDWWNEQPLAWTDSVGVTTTCPSPSAASVSPGILL